MAALKSMRFLQSRLDDQFRNIFAVATVKEASSALSSVECIGMREVEDAGNAERAWVSGEEEPGSFVQRPRAIGERSLYRTETREEAGDRQTQHHGAAENAGASIAQAPSELLMLLSF